MCRSELTSLWMEQSRRRCSKAVIFKRLSGAFFYSLMNTVTKPSSHKADIHFRAFLCHCYYYIFMENALFQIESFFRHLKIVNSTFYYLETF